MYMENKIKLIHKNTDKEIKMFHFNQMAWCKDTREP